MAQTAVLQKQRPYIAIYRERLAEPAGQEIQVCFVVKRMAAQVVDAEMHGNVFAVPVHLLGFTKAVEKTERIPQVEIRLSQCPLVADFLEEARRLEMVLNRSFVIVEPLKDSAEIRGELGQRRIV